LSRCSVGIIILVRRGYWLPLRLLDYAVIYWRDAFQHSDSGHGSYAYCHCHTFISCTLPPPSHIHKYTTNTPLVPQSQKEQDPGPQTNSPHLLRRRPRPNPAIPPLRLPPHRRRAPGLHLPKSPQPNMGQDQRSQDPSRPDRRGRYNNPDATRPRRHRAGRRQDMVAMATSRQRAKSRMDRDARRLPRAQEIRR
jgi:hypothetical protein